MKRTWILALAVLPLVIGLALAQSTKENPPILVARDVFADAGLIFSADEKRVLAVRDESAYGRISAQIVDLQGKSRVEVLTDSIDPFLFFSPNGQWIYQLDLDSYYGSTDDLGMDYRRPTPDGKIGIIGRDALHDQSKATIRFTFPGSDKDFYGASLHGQEIIVESRQRTWHLDANDLQILSSQPQKRKLAYVNLCPDGETLYHRIYRKVDNSIDFWEFLDLKTGKPLWKMPDDNTGFPQLSSDGQLLLKNNNNEIIARDTRTGAEQWRFRGPKSQNIALSPDESAIYEARANGELWKWPR